MDLLMAGEGSETTILLPQHTVFLSSFSSLHRLLILIGLCQLIVFVNIRRLSVKRVLIHTGFKYLQQIELYQRNVINNHVELSSIHSILLLYSLFILHSLCRHLFLKIQQNYGVNQFGLIVHHQNEYLFLLMVFINYYISILIHSIILVSQRYLILYLLQYYLLYP